MFGDIMRRLPAVHVYGTPVVVQQNPSNIAGPPSSLPESPSSPESLLPAIDGPPSPERIRAYTEAMKRSSIFGNNSRTGTFSSASSEHATLSRKSSIRSNSSNMGSIRSDRPESIQIFGSIFSRSGRKLRRENSAGSSGKGSASSITLSDSVIEEESAKDHYFGKKSMTRTRKKISAPKNFQHITHTRQDHLPNLHRTSRMELVSEFSAIRASQVPSNGELKGIRAQDLHFENFSSEALSAPNGEPLYPQPRSSRPRVVSKKPLAPTLRPIGVTKSHDNLRAAPLRPPRSPLSPTCPIALPARTSSRTASVLFDQFDPLATTTIERPYTSGAFRKPSPFNLSSPSNGPTWEEQQASLTELPISHAATTPVDEAWPLTGSLSGTFGQDLTDVQEEEEFATRSLRLSVELRASQSVPALRRRSLEQAETTEPLTQIASNDTTVPKKELPVTQFPLRDDSWESDIDWCYENEVEADCDYDWNQYSDENASIRTATEPKPAPPILQLKVQNDERVYNGRFRPSLLVSSPDDLSQLSPVSNTSTPSSDPRTPAFLRPKHVRSQSQASSFKESHGFHLSPTLLIPADFQSQIEQDAIYQEQFVQDSTSASIFIQEPFGHPFSQVDENESSTASYRSSNFSRDSARSSSSTRISSATSRGSQDSIVLFSRAASLTQAHRSIGSASSLPDLIHSIHLQPHGSDLPLDMAALSVSDDILDSAPAPGIAGPAPTLASLQHRRRKSLALEQGLRTLASANPLIQVDDMEKDHPASTSTLSPVPESFPEMPVEVREQRQIHGRKVSAPVSSSAKEFKGRARSATAATGKVRASYALFPQV